MVEKTCFVSDKKQIIGCFENDDIDGIENCFVIKDKIFCSDSDTSSEVDQILNPVSTYDLMPSWYKPIYFTGEVAMAINPLTMPVAIGSGCGDQRGLGKYYDKDIKFVGHGYGDGSNSFDVADLDAGSQDSANLPDQVVTDGVVEDVAFDTKKDADTLIVADVEKDLVTDIPPLDAFDGDGVIAADTFEDAAEVDVSLPVEECNGLDDDGDGEVDEPEDLTPPLATIQNGICAGLLRICEGEAGWYDPQPVDIASMQLVDGYELDELNCDDEDNDCDGLIDEDLGSQTCGEGVCENTVMNCLNGALQTCAPNWAKQIGEVCNGLDNDCDGMTDEDDSGLPIATSCYTGSWDLVGTGVCKAGIRECISGQFDPVCKGQVLSSAEVCNELDDDCDGETDNTGAFIQCGEGVCAHMVSGCVSCIDPFQGATAELCDDEDHDCDGDTLNGFNVGVPCDNGELGECFITGAFACTADGLGTQCDAPAGTSVAEKCDVLDHDCDSDPINGFNVGGACDNGELGECLITGAYVCTADGLGTECDAPAGTSVAEKCDALDQDCDGNPVNGFNVGDACNNGELGECLITGAYVCSVDGLTTECDAPPGTSVAEKCDGLDHDCDGDPMNGFSVGGACDNGELGECLITGAYVCSADGLTTECDAPAGTVGTETCNDLDDDCDGTKDNNMTAAPATKQDGLCAGSVEVCDGLNGWIEPDYTAIAGYEAGVETLCDQQDNNCDGLVDEGLPGATFMALCASACPTPFITEVFDNLTSTSYSGDVGANTLYDGLELFKSCTGDLTITLNSGSCSDTGAVINLVPDTDLCNMFNHVWELSSGAVCGEGCFSSISVDPFANVTKFNFCADDGSGGCDSGSVSDTNAYFNAGNHDCQAPYDANCN